MSDGTELPKGTMLLGKITTDDMQQQGTKKLALRFDQARLKDGTTVPIRATIVGFYAASGWRLTDEAPANNWTASTLEFDQEGIASGVDLHSKIASQNSGVFVSTKKDDVKLKQGSEIQFAIAAANGGQNGVTAAAARINSIGSPAHRPQLRRPKPIRRVVGIGASSRSSSSDFCCQRMAAEPISRPRTASCSVNCRG